MQDDKSAVVISLDENEQTQAKLKRDVQEAIAEVERGDLMSIDEVFELAKNAYRD